jgi:hypothetical protein
MTPIAVTILYDPNDLFGGAIFGSQDFNISLRTGTWPPGMRVRRQGHEYVVKTVTLPYIKHGWKQAIYRRTWALVDGTVMLLPAHHRGGATLMEMRRRVDA